MSKSLENLIWASPLKSDRKLLLLALAHHADGDGVTFPGVPLLARKTGLTTRGVEKILNAFVAAGTLSVVERGNGRGNTNKYRIMAAGLSQINPEPDSGFIEPENPEQEVNHPIQNPERNGTNPELGSVIELNPEPQTPNDVQGFNQNPEPDSGFSADELALNPERDAGAYKEQLLKEPKKYISGTNVPGADAPTEGKPTGKVRTHPERRKPSRRKVSSAAPPPGSLTRKECYSLFCEIRQSIGEYEGPYQEKDADFVMLARLFKNCAKTNWALTRERFTQAAQNYFATPQGAHTLADFASRFSDFYKNALNEFKRPTKASNGAGSKAAFSPAAQQTIAAGEAFIKRMEGR